MLAALASRRLSFDLFRFGERRQQRLSVGDLRQFWRRRKVFKRRRKDRVGFGGTGRRLVELGEGQRSLQAETARVLFLRDCD